MPPKRSRRVPARKVSRACIHCRNAHITCDEGRPCKRCVKKGLADTCVDAPRKTRKYLLPGEDEIANGFMKPMRNEERRKSSHTAPSVTSEDINFLSSAADSEYAILGNIIDQDPNGPTLLNSKFVSPALSAANSEELEYLNYQPLMQESRSRTASPFVKPLQPIDMNFDSNKNDNVSGNGNSANDTQQGEDSKLTNLYPDMPHCDANTNQYYIGTMATIDGVKTHTFPDVVKQISKFKREHPQKFRERNKRSAISFSIGVLEDSNYTPELEAEITANVKKPSEIYEKVKSPFAYVKPYHELNMYLKKRFSKENLVQVSKSIAEYRPSFIAGMIKLKEDDLIFAEQCFQRTLLEYESYIGISGTPILVWRRTSQIAYVGDEFCILTGWSKEDLLSKSTFAVEIMDDKSCVEYFKIFSKIAFGDLSGDIMTECTLLTPKGESIRTSSTWTLKRDVFGIPMMIIATFLPILT
ncbi:Transcription activator of gluconeogenesis ERT1 [Pichia kudriavzevii]|uniref:Transcription activator of gluconeogenesis ERT1 n=1 Tax=Pichia kudriavzevii TaxID=4909 RepID=A0A1V2LGM6_PICKU|nr:Transcription activator of gluconeogenesis ERT1 [Pichia kudriavzevii]